MLTKIFNSARKNIIKKPDLIYILNIIYSNRILNHTSRLIIFEIIHTVLVKNKYKKFIITSALISCLLSYLANAEEREIKILYKLLLLIENKTGDKLVFKYEIYNALIEINERNILLVSPGEMKIIEIFESLIFNYHLNEEIFTVYFLPLLFSKQYFKYEEIIHRILYLFYLKADDKQVYLKLITDSFRRISCQNQIIIFTSFLKIQENLPNKIFTEFFTAILCDAFRLENLNLIEKIALEIKNENFKNLIIQSKNLLLLLYEKIRDCSFAERKFLYLNIFDQIVADKYDLFRKYYLEHHEKYKRGRTGKVLY